MLQVLFPLLHLLLENVNVNDPHGIEETRMRASTLLCKVSACELHCTNCAALLSKHTVLRLTSRVILFVFCLLSTRRCSCST